MTSNWLRTPAQLAVAGAVVLGAGGDAAAPAQPVVAWAPAAQAPCSRLLVYAEGPTINGSRLLGVSELGGVPEVVYDGPQSEIDPDWSPDGRALAIAARSVTAGGAPVDNALQVYDVTTGDVRTLVRQPRLGLRFPAWSPDGTQIAYASGVGGTGLSAVRLIPSDAVSGAQDRLIVALPAPFTVRDIVWSPDGRRLLITAARSTTAPAGWAVWSLNADGSGLRLVDDSGHAGYVQFTRDGERVVVEKDTVVDDRVVTTIYFADPELEELHPILTDPDDEWGPILSNNDQDVAYLDLSDNSVHVLHLPSGADRELVPPAPSLAPLRSSLTWQPYPRCGRS